MKHMKFIPLAMLTVLMLASCQSREIKIKKLVTNHLEQSLENPQKLKVLEIAEPDSAFGLNYFTKQEQAYMMNTITDVTSVLMERTAYMTKPDLDDAYTMTLASGMLGEAKKGEWSGWKVRVTYTAKSKYGCKYKAQRWYFLDKDCQTVIRHFDLPIVSTDKADKTTKGKRTRQDGKSKQTNPASKIVLSTVK